MWEKIQDVKPEGWPSEKQVSARLKVPGGWLVRSALTLAYGSKGDMSFNMTQTFVADPEHAWVLVTG